MSTRELQTRYVIKGDASGGIRVMRQMRDEVTAVGTEFDKSGKRSQAFKQNVTDTSQEIDFLKRTALSAGVAVAAMFSVRNTIGTADEYSQMASRIRLVTDSMLEYDEVQQRLMETARNTYKPLMDVSELFVNTVRPLKEVGFATQDVLDLTEALAAGMVISGTKAQASTSLIDQFGKAMIAGKLQGDAYNAVIQNAPRLQQALADGLGVTTRELNEMATAGKLTANVVMPALNGQVAAMVDELERMPTSVEDARVVFSNAWLDYIGRANEAHSATGVLASGIELAADNIEMLAEVGLAAGVVLAGRGVQALGSYAAATARRAESERRTAQETQRRLDLDRQAAALTARRAAAENQQAMQEAQRAQQRAVTTRAEAAQDVSRLERLQAQLVAEKALAAQQLQRQTTAAGRVQVQGRIAQLNAVETTTTQQLTAAKARLTQAEIAETSATRTATIAKIQYRRAVEVATPATLAQIAAARASALAHGSMAVAIRGAQGAMALMGGPAGAALLAVYGLYRLTTGMTEASREAQAARQEIYDLSTTAEDAAASFDKLTLAQRNLTMQNLASEIEDNEAQMRRSLNRIMSLTQATGMTMDLSRFGDLRTAIDEVKEGVREAGTLAEFVSSNFAIPDTVLNTITSLADNYDTAAQKAEGLSQRQRDLEGSLNGATSSIDAQTRALEANRSAATDYLARVNESIAQLMDPSNEGRALRWIASQDGGIPEEIAQQIIQAERFRDQWDADQKARRESEQAAAAASRESAQLAATALRERTREAERVKKLYDDQVASMERDLALHGQVGEVARLRYELEQGSLKELNTTQGDRLLQLREELSLVERRSELISQYVPDLERLKSLQRDSMAIDMLDPGLGNLAAAQLERELQNVATQGLNVPTYLDASVSGPFGEADRMQRELDRYREQYQSRLDILREFTQEQYGVESEAQRALLELQRKNTDAEAHYDRQIRQARMAGNAAMYGDLAGMARVFAGEQSSIFRGLFSLQKAYSLASTMVASYDAIAKAWASAPFPGNVPIVAKTVMETGALQAALQAVQPVGMSHAGVDRIPKEGTWLLDQGQRVMMSQQADELDRFLAREKQAVTQNVSNSKSQVVQLSVPVTVKGVPGMSSNEAELQGHQIGDVVETRIMSVLQRERRYGGLLYAG